jgi:type II restriction/modification system DNA methylase subunit YeeA
MNKTAIKNFAIWSRNKLIADVSYEAGLLGIDANGIQQALPQSTADTEFYDIGLAEPHVISCNVVKQRKQLADLIRQKADQIDYQTAYDSVIEEVAYTWFNRLIAIRFMEVNDYLPSHVRVLSSDSTTKMEPDMVTNPFDTDFDFSSAETATIQDLKEENKVDDLFRMLFIKQCNILNKLLPKLFEKTTDYTEVLLSLSVTDQDGVVYHLVHDIPEEDFNISTIGEDGKPTGQVEIIGWLYQYYNTEPKNQTFSLLKKNVKITKERIPSATQLFTPDWIVRYMVENSLGRLWIEGHPNESLKEEWKYYLDEAEQEPNVKVQLDQIRAAYKNIKPEDIKVIDPCMGSGHILVYAFDILMQIYESQGYMPRDAAKSILENNLYGLDIDDRAFQLAYFAVLMKARQYNRRILNDHAHVHVYSIQESNAIDRDQLKYFGTQLDDLDRHAAVEQMNKFLDTLVDAKEYGSIIDVKQYDWKLLRQFTAINDEEEFMVLDFVGLEDIQEQLSLLIDVGETMAMKYDVVVTNPPYMGSGSMGAKLSNYVKKHYPDSKADLFAVFIERCGEMTKKNRYQAMITQHAWMFLSSFEKLREKITSKMIVNMAHLGARAFDEIGGEVVQTTSFILQQSHILSFKGTYCRLIEPTSQQGKEDLFLSRDNQYAANQDNFTQIPGSPIAYWLSEKFTKIFQGKRIEQYSEKVCKGIFTGNNDKYLRMWFEVNFNTIPNIWNFYSKGGAYRKWYGNSLYIVYWREDGAILKNDSKAGTGAAKYYGHEHFVWSGISNSLASFRYDDSNVFFDDVSPAVIFNDGPEFCLLGLLNSKVVEKILTVIAPTMHFQSGDIKVIPIRENIFAISIRKITDNILLSKNDWDSFETSWNFAIHPLLKYRAFHVIGAEEREDFSRECEVVSSCFETWKSICNNRFNTLKANEEELNHIFIDIYGLQDELSPNVADKNITVARIYDTKEGIPDCMKGNDYVLTKPDVIKSLISYAVGCMFGRYSLDVPGLTFAGGDWDDSKYRTFIPDKDNVIPITDEDYFDDDIVGLFCAWMKKAYGKEKMEENLTFIAQALGNKGNTSRDIIRNYFLKDFFKDHVKTYKKRPIYWLFDSGRQNGFKALIYLHRYDENTIGNLRVDYLHRMERIYENEITRMQDMADNSTNAREATAAAKRKEKLQKQLKECKEYDEKISHLALARTTLDLDDGVKVNYEKVQTGKDGKKYTVLAKI